MEDERVWHHERQLWTGSVEDFARAIDETSLMVIPAPPFVLAGDEIVQALAKGTRFSKLGIAHGRITRPQEGLILVAYKAAADGHGEPQYLALCTTSWRRIAHDDWLIVQHQQTPTAAGPFRSAAPPGQDE